jgi:YegS/Rv2252/BmrU family lipid kinase
MPRSIRVIFNPVAGQQRPVLGVLSRTLTRSGLDWDIWMTRGVGDAVRLATRAMDERAEVVAVYGGDGTVAEVGGVLAGSEVSLAILPGGTANVLAAELGLPFNLTSACELACDFSAPRRLLDMGEVNGRPFLVAVSIGFLARMVEMADREAKARMGFWAYVLSGARSLVSATPATFFVRVDGRDIETSAITCVIGNIVGLGSSGLCLAPDVRPDDGKLDMVTIRNVDLLSLVSVTASMFARASGDLGLPRWSGREIELEAVPPQPVQVDGEMIGMTPVRVSIRPRALSVVVPASV